MSAELWPILLLGFGLGMMHALDADHVMALLTLNNQKTRLRRIVSCSTYWALGHGGVLLFSGILLFGFGVMIPETLQWLAELSVGVVLIVLGIACLWQFRKARLKLHTHGDVQHIHWHTSDHEQDSSRSLKDSHKPLMIGMLHGLAGSAPALALIPALNQGHVLLATLYLSLFSVGMMLSMICCGLSFVYCQQFVQKRFQKVFDWSRHILAFASMGLGTFWLIKAGL
ncbi:MAG: sulfite exporter TauE/SafE family protein [Arenicella sp.]